VLSVFGRRIKGMIRLRLEQVWTCNVSRCTSTPGVLPTVVRHCVWSRNIKNGCSICIWH